MYNQEIKHCYIDYYCNEASEKNKDTRRRKMIVFFDKLGVIEEKLQTDAADADLETVTLMIKMIITTTSKSSIKPILGSFKSYIDWAIENKYSVNTQNYLNVIQNSNLSDLSVCEKTMVFNEAQLLDYLDICFEPIVDNAISINYRLYCLLVFAGVHPKEAQYIKKTDVDIENRNLYIGKFTITLTDALVSHITTLLGISQFVASFNRNGINSRRLYDKANTKFLLDFATTDRKNIPIYFKSALSDASKRFRESEGQDKRLVALSLYKSGVFYRAFLQKQKTGLLNLDEMNRFQNEKFKASEIKEQNRSNKTHREEYQSWEDTFVGIY